MKRFAFDLASVLRLAEFEHSKVLVELGRLNAELSRLRARGDLLRSVVLHQQQEIETAGMEGLRAAYYATLTDGMRQNEVDCSRVSAELREVRLRLETKRQRRDSLRKLEERRRKAWRIEGEKLEQRELEELAAMRSFGERMKR